MDDLQKNLQLVKAGDNDAIGELYVYLYNSGIELAKKYMLNQQDAEDIFQDAFLKTVSNIESYDSNQDFQPWFNTILIRTCLSENSARNRHELHYEDFKSSDEENDVSFIDQQESKDDATQPESAITRSCVMDLMNGFLEELPEEQREAIVLYYYSELSVSQIAEYQQVNEGTVKSRLNYGRKKVEERVEAYQKKTGDKLYTPILVPFILFIFFRYSTTAKAAEITIAKAKPFIDAVSGGKMKFTANEEAQGGLENVKKIATKIWSTSTGKITVVAVLCAVVVGSEMQLTSSKSDESDKQKEEQTMETENDAAEIQENDTQEAEEVVEAEKTEEDEVEEEIDPYIMGYYDYCTADLDGDGEEEDIALTISDYQAFLTVNDMTYDITTPLSFDLDIAAGIGGSDYRGYVLSEYDQNPVFVADLDANDDSKQIMIYSPGSYSGGQTIMVDYIFYNSLSFFSYDGSQITYEGTVPVQMEVLDLEMAIEDQDYDIHAFDTDFIQNDEGILCCTCAVKSQYDADGNISFGEVELTSETFSWARSTLYDYVYTDVSISPTDF